MDQLIAQIRKEPGATETQMLPSRSGQFLGESVLLAAISVAAGFGIAALTLPWFGTFLGRPLAFQNSFGLPLLLAGAAVLALLLGFLAGIYPALLLSRFRPSRILQHRFAARDPPGRRRGDRVDGGRPCKRRAHCL